MDLEDLEYVQSTLKLLGSKGTTGTQASFLELFDGDQETIDKIDPMIAEKMGFKNCYPVSGQTYSRKVDTRVLNVLAGIAASATKFSNDIRLLQHLKEVEEPFEKGQIGSSAMAYKRNPMRSERIASLSRYVITDALNPAITSSVQWFERTLDDSANKRLSIPEGFLAIDGILDLCMNVVDGLVVYPKVILKHMMAELPFMATENIMMDAVKAGGDRQELHERIRELSMIAGKHVKEEGRDNDLLDLIAADEMFHLTKEESFWKQPRRIIRKHCFFWEWYIWPRMMWKMLRQCTSSIFPQWVIPPRAIMVWHCAISEAEIMIPLLITSQKAFRQLPQTRCRVFCSMRS